MTMKTTYVIENSVRQKLSSYYPNALKGQQLVYRESDWYSFSTAREAREFIKYIQSSGIGRNLHVKSRLILVNRRSSR